MNLYATAYKYLAGFFRRFYRIEVIGAENEPDGCGFIACSNHLSNHDVIVVAAALKHQVHFFAKAELFKIPLLGSLVRALGAFPVRRGQADVSAIKTTISIVGEGKVVGFYPQGTRYPGVHPARTEPRDGIGMLVCRGKATVLPIALETSDFKIRPFHKTVVRIGEAITYESWQLAEDESGRCIATKDDYHTISVDIFERITDMIPPR